ncbi:MAG: ATP-binding protein [Chlamydiota bacterium]
MDRMIFQAQLEMLDEMMEWISTHIEGMGFSSAESKKIQLAMEEALVNIISYAYKDDKGTVELICNAYPNEKITFTIMDKGASFNPLLRSNKAPADVPLEEQEEGGLGIFFIRQLMDEVHYEHQHPYNVLTVIKILS